MRARGGYVVMVTSSVCVFGVGLLVVVGSADDGDECFVAINRRNQRPAPAPPTSSYYLY